MKIFKKTILVLIILVFGMVTPALAVEENKKINLSNLNILESIGNIFEKIETKTSNALDKLQEDVNKRNGNEEISQEDNNENEEVSKTTTKLIDKLKTKSESLTGSNLLSILKERLSSIKIDLKIFDKLKNNNEEEEQLDEQEEQEEINSSQDLTKGTENLISLFENKGTVNLIDGSLVKRVDSFFNTIIDAIR